MTDVLIKPAFVSLVADSGDAAKLGPNAWNAARVFSAGALGDLVFRDTGSATGASYLPDVAAGSYLRSAGVGAAPVWSTVTLPNAATTGDLFMASGANAMGSLADVAVGQVLASGGVGAVPAWTATPTLTSVVFSGGSALEGSTANIVEQRNGTSAQTLRVYNTFTNTTNYERAIFAYSGNTLYIGSQKAGTGAARAIFFGTNPTGVPDAAVSISGTVINFYPNNLSSWVMTNLGHLVSATDNAYDFGQTNATRPRHAHFAGYVAIGDGIAAPGAGTGEARIYVDTADGDLKVIFADGTIKTIVVDT